MVEVTRAAIAAHPFESLVSASVSKFPIDAGEFYGRAGQQHYRLLSFLASQFNDKTILDIGTHKGSSALALSTNPTNQVISFDIQRKVPLHDLSNVSFELANLWNPTVRRYWEPTILSAAMIVLDIDPHDGPMELEFYEWLKGKGYKGLLVCDDIWYFKGMRDNFWFQIPTEYKLDITPLGHWSGTGIVAFEPQPFIWETFQGLQEVCQSRPSSPWTVVTAYFDLTRMPDASDAIKARDKKHYFQSARATLALDQPLVVYCEPDSLEELKALRPARLMDKTRFIAVEFDTLPLSRFRDQIVENRKKHPTTDPRNTPSYYLLCMARYALLKRTIEENPFGSTHFAWLNICIERMGYKNVAHLEDVFLLTPRDKVSTTYIDYIPHDDTKDAAAYFKAGGRCSLCSGFFTGRAAEFKEFCDKVDAQFMKYLEAGYGHADEQLFSPVYFENRDLFEVYFGDYQQMITNYRATHENPEITLRLVIPKAFAAGDKETCAKASHFLLESHKKGWITLSVSQLAELNTYVEKCGDMLIEPEIALRV
jgi:hypothetical protein